MKERTFYTINLDLRRIVILSIIFLGIVAYSFGLGMTFGKKRAEKGQEPSIAGVKTEKDPQEGFPEEKPPIRSEEEYLPQVNNGSEKNKSAETKTAETKPAPEKTDVKKEEKKTETKPPEVKPVEKKAEIKPPRKKKTALKKIEIEDQNFYTLQLGAFSSQEQAQKFKDNVVSESKTGRFSPFVQKNGELFVVRIGKAKDRDEIEKYLKSLDARLQSTSMVVKNSH